MAEPKALGMVLAMLVDPAGKPVRDGSAKGQLYVTEGEVVVVRPGQAAELMGRVAMGLLAGSVVAVVVNLFTWKSKNVLWGAVAAQAVYWLTLPSRRRAMEPLPRPQAELDELRRAGRVAIQVPLGAILRAVPSEPLRSGVRKPARFELSEGALEMYLSDEQFRAVAAAVGR